MERRSFPAWQAMLNASRSEFFRGHTADRIQDRAANGPLAPSAEALFTQSNARVLIGQAANGAFRMIALPTQVYPAPTGAGEFGLGPGMYHHFDVAMYAGDLSYQLLFDSADVPIDLAADSQEVETVYADHFLPLSRTRVGALEVALISVAPVAADSRNAPLAPAPLPGPAGALYVLHLRNAGTEATRGRIILQAGDLLVGHYEDAAPAMRALKRPDVDMRQGTVILSRPCGSVGIHFHDGRWTRAGVTGGPFQAERAFSLAPGEEAVFETHVALGHTYGEVMPVIYALHMRPALDWIKLTASFWRARLGELAVDADDASEEARFSRDIYIRSLLDNFNCLQTGADGELIAHWQGAPSHGYGTVWGIDVEPTAVSIVHVCPELARQVMLFFLTRSRAPVGSPDHSVPILVAPVIIARQWLQATGDVVFFERRPDVVTALQGIMDELLDMQAAGEALFPSRYSSDGPVGRRYDYGTNVKAWYAFDSMAYLLRALGRAPEAERYVRTAGAIRTAIECRMAAQGPFGPQISGGTNLGEDPGTFYLPEGSLYYDGEDTSSMLAPVYGLCDFTYRPWVNYHRFARSLWCPNYDPEFDALLWSPAEPAVVDGTSFFSRLGGSVTRAEMREGLAALRELGVDDATGSAFWWPHGREHRRALTRCSQGQGAWAWQYLGQWLGVEIDAVARMLTLAPRGLLSQVDWEGFAGFDVHWSESAIGATARIRNDRDGPWTVRVGFRPPGSGADAPLRWQTFVLEPGREVTLAQQCPILPVEAGLERAALARAETVAFGDADGVVFRRYGPALLWGHWDADLAWDLGQMPLALRFVILNGSGANWTNVVIELACPAAWTAQGRQPGHWTRPEQMTGGTIRLEIGDLPALHRTVAPFWVREPRGHELRWRWGDDSTPFHAPSQPGPGLTLRAPDVAAPEEVSFRATLIAEAADGREVRRELVVPVRIEPVT